MNHSSAVRKLKKIKAGLPESTFSKIAPIYENRAARKQQYRKQTAEAVAEFNQLDFAGMVKEYNKTVEAVNKAVYRLKKSGADISAFTDLSAAPELMTDEGRFAKFGKNTLDKYAEATEAQQKRAEDYLLKDYQKLKTISEGVGKKEYNRRVKEKAEIEQALWLDKPITWKEYAATQTVKNQITSADYYALLLYADDVGYLPDLHDQSEIPKIKVKDYGMFLDKINTWLLEQENTSAEAVYSMEDLKKRALKDATERPRLYTAKYGDKEERRIVAKRGSLKLGL